VCSNKWKWLFYSRTGVVWLVTVKINYRRKDCTCSFTGLESWINRWRLTHERSRRKKKKKETRNNDDVVTRMSLHWQVTIRYDTIYTTNIASHLCNTHTYRCLSSQHVNRRCVLFWQLGILAYPSSRHSISSGLLLLLLFSIDNVLIRNVLCRNETRTWMEKNIVRTCIVFVLSSMNLCKNDWNRNESSYVRSEWKYIANDEKNGKCWKKKRRKDFVEWAKPGALIARHSRNKRTNTSKIRLAESLFHWGNRHVRCFHIRASVVNSRNCIYWVATGRFIHRWNNAGTRNNTVSWHVVVHN
jgi:hypothetical protein